MRQWLLVVAGALLAAVATGTAAKEPVAIPHVSGGIGVGEQETLKAREKEFNLKLVFTLIEGNYLAGVGVQIKDAAGATLFEHLAGGPFFLARLAPGRYIVSATYEGRSVTRKVEIGRTGLRTEYFRWPANPQTDVALPAESQESPKPAGKAQRR